MKRIPGITDVKLYRDIGQPNLNFTIDRQQAARFGINVSDIQDVIETAVGGKAVSQVLLPGSPERYDVVVRYQEPYRRDQKAISNIRLLSPSGERVSLAQLTKMEVRDGAYDIYREGNSRYVSVTFNVRGRDLGSSVEDAMAQINQKVKFPPGYRVEWSGEYESAKRAQARLAVIVPLTILIIFIILYTMFRSAKWALLILAVVAMAPIGGLLALLAHRHVFQRVLGHRLPGAFRCIGANRRHHAGVHQSAPGAGSLDRGCRHRRRGAPASSHHDDDAGGDVRAGAGGDVARDRFRFAAAVCHRHRRRSDRGLVMSIVLLPTLYVWIARDGDKLPEAGGVL